MEPVSKVGVVGDSLPTSFRVPLLLTKNVEPQVKILPLISKVPAVMVQVDVGEKAVDKERLPPDLLMVKGEEKVPLVWESVWVPEPEKFRGKLAPPKVPPDWEKLPVIVIGREEAGLEIVPLEIVKSPVVKPWEKLTVEAAFLTKAA